MHFTVNKNSEFDNKMLIESAIKKNYYVSPKSGRKANRFILIKPVIAK